MADVSKVNVNGTDYNIKDSNAMHKGVDYVTAGQKTGTTLGSKATAEGGYTTASGGYSHAEGNTTVASALYAHAEGASTTASKQAAHAEGFNTKATGYYSHAEGHNTIAAGDSQHVEGKHNVEDANNTYAHIIGGGTGDNNRKNIFTVDWNGDVNAGRSNGLTNDTKLPTGADVISYLNSNLANKLVVSNLINLSAYSASTLIQTVSNNGHDVYIASCSGGNRVSDLPVVQAGTYVVIPNTYYVKIIFFGGNGCVYIYTDQWIAVVTK